MSTETGSQTASKQRKTTEEREESRIDLLTLIIGFGAGLIALFIRLLIGLLVEEGWLRAFFRGRKVTKIIVPEG